MGPLSRRGCQTATGSSLDADITDDLRDRTLGCPDTNRCRGPVDAAPGRVGRRGMAGRSERGEEFSAKILRPSRRPLLSVRGLDMRYGARIGGAGTSFDLLPEEGLEILGESGPGRFTLLACPAGHLRPDVGQVFFDTCDSLRYVMALAEAKQRRLTSLHPWQLPTDKRTRNPETGPAVQMPGSGASL